MGLPYGGAYLRFVSGRLLHLHPLPLATAHACLRGLPACLPAVWLINYRHFLSWKPLAGSWIPDPSTIEFSVSKATFYFKVGAWNMVAG